MKKSRRRKLHRRRVRREKEAAKQRKNEKPRLPVYTFKEWYDQEGCSCNCLTSGWANGHDSTEVMRLFSDFYISELFISLIYMRNSSADRGAGLVQQVLDRVRKSHPDDWMIVAAMMLQEESDEDSYRALNVLSKIFHSSSGKLENLLLRYLVRIVGGEARYWRSIVKKENETFGDVMTYLQTNGMIHHTGSLDRDQASCGSHAPCPICDPWRCMEYLTHIHRVFHDWPWCEEGGGPSYGGLKWAHITEVALSRVAVRAHLIDSGIFPFAGERKSTISEESRAAAIEIGQHPSSGSRAQFIDYVVDLQHNGGTIFNKGWLSVQRSRLHNWLNVKKSSVDPEKTIEKWDQLFKEYGPSGYPEPITADFKAADAYVVALKGKRPVPERKMSSGLQWQLALASLYRQDIQTSAPIKKKPEKVKGISKSTAAKKNKKKPPVAPEISADTFNFDDVKINVKDIENFESAFKKLVVNPQPENLKEDDVPF